MAAMWALTGNSDIRVEGGAGKTLTKTDVVNDYAKTARVRLEGAANGVPFWVERRVSRSKLLGLRYGVGDDERTLADSRLTQAAMDADLGASVAARIAFHGQHTVGQLLDANDAALKAALGELVDADTWQEAKDLSRKRVGEARKRAAALGADASARADYVRRIEQRLAAATAASEDWTAQVERNVSRLAREEEVAADALGARARRGGRRRRRAEGGERAVGRGGGGSRRRGGRRSRVLGPLGSTKRRTSGDVVVRGGRGGDRVRGGGARGGRRARAQVRARVAGRGGCGSRRRRAPGASRGWSVRGRLGREVRRRRGKKGRAKPTSTRSQLGTPRFARRACSP